MNGKIHRRRKSPLELAEARRSGYYNIGQAAEASGVSARMIRHYEAIGLIPRADRTFANYRIYSQNDIHTLSFIRRARSLGFSMKQIEGLLGLWRTRGRASSQVKALALRHVEELERRIGEMAAMRDTLRNLADHCHGDDRPECPILEDLAGVDVRRAGGGKSD
jgi:MerR family transcriptional regulator, copper efflux regulator